jgi:hypothetical protein
MIIGRYRVHFYSGWAIMAPPNLTKEYHDNFETLRLYDAEREICVSAMSIKKTDGTEAQAEAMLSGFPPPELQGMLLTHEGKNVRGRGVLLHAASDRGPAEWVLMGVHASLEAPYLLRVTIVTKRAADRPWAIETWRTIVYTGDDESRFLTLMGDPTGLIKQGAA